MGVPAPERKFADSPPSGPFAVEHRVDRRPGWAAIVRSK